MQVTRWRVRVLILVEFLLLGWSVSWTFVDLATDRSGWALMWAANTVAISVALWWAFQARRYLNDTET